MIEEAGIRFNPKDYYHLLVDTDAVTCEVDGFCNGVAVNFFGDAEAGAILGEDVEWNQLVHDIDVSSSYTATLNSSYKVVKSVPITADHVILASFSDAIINEQEAGKDIKVYLQIRNMVGSMWGDKLLKKPNASGTAFIGVSTDDPNIELGTFKMSWEGFNVYDLTKMFGADIADIIYAAETDNAGDGVKLFKMIAPDDYYEYNAGETMKLMLRKTE